MAEEPVVGPSKSTVSNSSSAAPLGNYVIPMVNKLQDIFAQLGSQSAIELPQVAVVGSQSSGKSSVLEALVGRDFLPRGPEICTRRPLVLQLLQTKKKSDGADEEWGEFLHLPGKRFFDFAEIRREIQAETDREAGGNKGVSDKQIRLKIFSPNVLDITLVDLPGITKVPIGDQPSDIEARIRTMIMSYIKVPSCLILAVTPANSDLANSDALQIAGNADHDGVRTIGVITKLDIMDRGTDGRNLLLGKVIPLRLGYIGVVNRSQEDIMYNRSIKEALLAEEKFFRSRPVYKGLADRCGVPQLAKKLNQILVQHIKAVLLGLKSLISSALVSVAKEHASYGEITESKTGQEALLLNILSKYSEAFSSMVEGKNEEMSTFELSGGARIHYIFQNIFVKILEVVDPCEDLTDDDIRTAIQNATGPKSALFVPEVPFEVLIRRQIARLLVPSRQCARFIYDELIKISHRCLVNEMQRFPVLRKRMDEVVRNFLQEGLEPSETMIGHIIEMEAETDREAGGNKGVSDKQIRLKIFSPNVLDITLVDLPGITKVPIGDQPSDIEARIRTMIMSYIKVPSCLILAVTPANSDLANLDALQIARNADPDGVRTIGVITKLDIMDRGTDGRNLLLGKVIPLRLGYIGVVNRSQEVYNGLADRCGVPQLAKKLNQILVQHIKAVLLGLKSRISSALVSVAKEHASYGEITESKTGQEALLLNILSKYSEAFSSMVEGKNEEMSTSELSGGARIHYIFQNIFVKILEEVDPCEDLTDDDIRTAIQNATGPNSALFVPEVPFEVLIRRQIARPLVPSRQCARFIYDELIKISHRCLVNEMQRFPVLRKRMDEVVRNFLQEGLEPSETMIGHIIEMEMDYINTSHPNFLGGSKAVETAMQQVKSSRITTYELLSCIKCNTYI